ncbi:MAG: hypothetical protein ACI31S_01440 [Bacilli bacterium]
MYEVNLLNKDGIKFIKYFDNDYKFNKFMNKLKYSKNLILLSYRRI